MKAILSIDEATPMLLQENHSKCKICIHKTPNTQFLLNPFGCCVTCLTMINKQGDCIWYEKGKPSSRGLNIELARERMNGEIIYFSRFNKDDGK